MMDPNANVSTNYLILSTGEIIGNVDEEHRAWTSGSPSADNPSITIEVQNSSSLVVNGDNMNPNSWPVTDAALASLVALIADIAKRYQWGIIGPSHVRGHQEFASTACPGGYLWHKLGEIRNAVNRTNHPAPTQKTTRSNEMYVRLNPYTYDAASAAIVYEVWRNPATGKREFYVLKDKNDAAAAAQLAAHCDSETLYNLGQSMGYKFGKTDPDVLTARAPKE